MLTLRSAAVVLSLMLAGALHLTLISCSEAPPPPPPVTGFVPDTKPAPPVRWVDAVVPEGTRLDLLIEAPTVPRGEEATPVRAKLAEAVMVGNIVVLPAGSFLDGDARRNTSGGGTYDIRFSSISTPTGAGAAIAVRPIGGGPGIRGSLSPGASLSVELDKPLEIKVKS